MIELCCEIEEVDSKHDINISVGHVVYIGITLISLAQHKSPSTLYRESEQLTTYIGGLRYDVLLASL